MKKVYLIIPLVVSLAFLIISFAAFASNPIITVKTDSMLPTLIPGDQLVISQVGIDEIKVGDIIAFDTHFEESGIITHRVIEVSETGDKIEFHTQGDHNLDPDVWIIDEESYIGLVGEVNPPLVGFQADAVRYPLIIVAIISAILLVIEFVKKKSLEIERLYCYRCDNRWYPRIIDGKVKIPDTCPNKDCRSPYWKTPRKSMKK